ncbi:MAG: enoyl-CoA hydratase/isomerase family protein [Pontibacterium sp.]
MTAAIFTQLFIKELDTGIWLLTLNRPKTLNALNLNVLEQISSAIRWIEAQPAARVVLMTGKGEEAFTTGEDINQMKEMTALQARAFSKTGMETMHAVESSRLPVIALINGYCLGGGCELAMSCDFILASEHAVFGQPGVALGISPGFGGSQRLARQVGPGMASQLLLTGEQIPAEEACRIGLCNQVLPAGELLARGLELAQKIAANAPQAVAFSKSLVNSARDMSIENGCRMETDLFSLCFTTEDQKEGMSAFKDRRKALFTGR